MTLHNEVAQPVSVKEILVMKEKLENLVDRLDQGGCQAIYFGKQGEPVAGQRMHALDKLHTAGGVQYRVCAREPDGRTGSGSYFPIGPEGRRAAIADFLDQAVLRIFKLRQDKKRFPTISRIQQTQESDFVFFPRDKYEEV